MVTQMQLFQVSFSPITENAHMIEGDNSNTGVIAGSIVGVIALCILIAVILLVVLRRRFVKPSYR